MIINDVNGWFYDIEETGEWPREGVRVIERWFDATKEGGVFQEARITAQLVGCDPSHLSAADIMLALCAVGPAVRDVRVFDSNYLVEINLFSDVMHKLFRNNVKYRVPDSTKVFGLDFMSQKVSANYELLQTSVSLLADAMYFSTSILTHAVKNHIISCRNQFIKKYSKVTQRDLMHVVEVYHTDTRDRIHTLSANSDVYSPNLPNGSTWKTLRGYLTPDDDTGPNNGNRRFLICLRQYSLEVYCWMHCGNINEIKSANNQYRVSLDVPIRFSVPLTHLTGSPSLGWFYTALRATSSTGCFAPPPPAPLIPLPPLVFSFHSHFAVVVERGLVPEDYARDPTIEEHGMLNVYMPTFIHDNYDYDLSLLEVSRKVRDRRRLPPHILKQWPVERSLRHLLDGTGMTFIISPECWVNAFRARIRNSDDLFKCVNAYRNALLQNALQFCPSFEESPTVRQRDGEDDCTHAATLIHTVLPIADTNRKTSIYFDKVLHESGRGYFCYGAMAMLVQNGWYPKRWVASLYDLHFGSHPRDSRYQTEIIAATVLFPNLYPVPDNVLFDTLKTIARLAQIRGRLTNIYRTYTKALSEAEARMLPLPLQTDVIVNLFHAYITPSRTYILGPYSDPSNRVLRKYQTESTSFMRATFVDSNRSRCTFSHRESRLLIYKMLFVFSTGFYFGSRVFKFLAYGNAQLKDASFWSLDDQHAKLEVEQIRRQLGNFDDSFVGKRAARLGQCFSATRQSLEVPEERQPPADDVITWINNEDHDAGFFTFTDGVGQFGDNIGKQVANAIGGYIVPSAVQIRFKGAKGMLVHDPNIHPDFIYLRPSQKKFRARDKHLEICEWSRPIPLQLNKDLILLLDTWGVPESAFMKILRQQEDLMRNIFMDRISAIQFLTHPRIQASCNLSNLLLWMIRGGFEPSQNYFMRAAMKHLRRWLWRHDLNEFRIPIRKGAVAYGVNDNTGVLAYDCGEGVPEIFLQVSHRSRLPLMSGMGKNAMAAMYNDDSQTERVNEDVGVDCRVVTGYILVTKSPCLNPGDIIVCKAVNKPELRHLVDVLVFPNPGPIHHKRHPGYGKNSLYVELDCSFDGPRDLPNMLSGGDLDGDTFQVIWDPDLVDPCVKRHLESPECPYPPAYYTIPFKDPPPIIDGYINKQAFEMSRKLSQMELWFAHFHKYDNLGIICTWWRNTMLHRDVFTKLKANSPECIDLAARASFAVDFAKSGKTADYPSDTRRPSPPYFLVKNESTMRRNQINYDCRASILGKIWDFMDGLQDPRGRAGEGPLYQDDGQHGLLTHEGFFVSDQSTRNMEALFVRTMLNGVDKAFWLTRFFPDGLRRQSDSVDILDVPVVDGNMLVNSPQVENLWALFRVDMDLDFDTDGAVWELDLLVTDAWPADCNRRCFSWTVNLLAHELPIDLGRMDECRSLLARSQIKNTVLLFGLKIVNYENRRRFVVKSASLSIRKKTHTSAMSRETTVVCRTNDARLCDVSMRVFDRIIPAYGTAPTLAIMSDQELSARHQNLVREAKHREEEQNAFSAPKEYTSMSRALVLLYTLINSLGIWLEKYVAQTPPSSPNTRPRVCTHQLPESLRRHQTPEGVTVIAPIARKFVVCVPYATFKAALRGVLQGTNGPEDPAVKVTYDLMRVIALASEFKKYFFVYDDSTHVLYTWSQVPQTWSPPHVQIVHDDLPAFEDESRVFVCTWELPHYVYSSGLNYTYADLHECLEIARRIQPSSPSEKCIEYLRIMTDPIASQLPAIDPATEWIELKSNYSSLLLSQCPEVDADRLGVYLWLPHKERVTAFNVGREVRECLENASSLETQSQTSSDLGILGNHLQVRLNADAEMMNWIVRGTELAVRALKSIRRKRGAFASVHDLTKSEKHRGPLGILEHHIRADYVVRFDRSDILSMIQEITDAPHPSVFTLNPQFYPNEMSNLNFENEVNQRRNHIEVDRRLIHKAVGSHFHFGSIFNESVNTRIKALIADLDLDLYQHEIACITGCLHSEKQESSEKEQRAKHAMATILHMARMRAYWQTFYSGNESDEDEEDIVPADLPNDLNNVHQLGRASGSYVASLLSVSPEQPWHPLLFVYLKPDTPMEPAERTAMVRAVKKHLMLQTYKWVPPVPMCSVPYIIYGTKFVDLMCFFQEVSERARLKQLVKTASYFRQRKYGDWTYVLHQWSLDRLGEASRAPHVQSQDAEFEVQFDCDCRADGFFQSLKDRYAKDAELPARPPTDVCVCVDPFSVSRNVKNPSQVNGWLAVLADELRTLAEHENQVAWEANNSIILRDDEPDPEADLDALEWNSDKEVASLLNTVVIGDLPSEATRQLSS